ncbi:meiotic recombination protein REC114 isoform X2 [Numida meleagris]|uniref:meiotic recombination protein REC114 isoform X2 n=1 Tax=Numida meleagris TaxID=8996 RepID=UPI000B3DAAD1|nr:meiotic recombination protein REC114 isoform X2 [Numida meleagris]
MSRRALFLLSYWLLLPARPLTHCPPPPVLVGRSCSLTQHGSTQGLLAPPLRGGPGLLRNDGAAERRRQHLPPRQRHDVAPEALRPLPAPDGQRRRGAKRQLLEGDGVGEAAPQAGCGLCSVPLCGAGLWVFESNEESGHLVLTIVVSGHFFISQGRTVLEGFSLIDSQKWLRIVRRADCLLLHAQSKNECRMFRVQFGGDSKEQTQEHCCSCVQKLTEYVPVQVADEQSQNLCYSLSQVEDAERNNTSGLCVPDEPLPDSCMNFGERRSTKQLAQSVLKQKLELPLVYQHSVWSAQELGPFIRLCLMDQHFPAFVEDVEKELKKLTEG